MTRPDRPVDPPVDPPVEPPGRDRTNPPDPELVYPDGAPDDSGKPRKKSKPAGRAGDGQWLDPDSGMPVEFPLDDPPEGETWTERDIRDRRAAWRALGPAQPTTPPARTEDERAQEGYREVLPDARSIPQTPANLDERDRPHFLRNIGGEEVCGQDGEPWPCDTYRAWMEDGTREVATAVPTPDTTDHVTGALARMLGVDPQDMALFLASRKSK
jgi:hypothetical protein